MKARTHEADHQADLNAVGLFRLALYAMDQAHRLANFQAARHFDEAALALAAQDATIRSSLSCLPHAADAGVAP